jgi:hypothetical protein
MSRNHDAQVLAGSGGQGRATHGVLIALALLLAACAGGCAGSSAGKGNKQPEGIDPDDIPALSKLLVAGQLPGRVHAAVPDRGIYVFTFYRNPKNVFVAANYPMTPANPEVAKRLAEVKRHDGLLIKGSFIDNRAPIKHIRLDDFQITSVYKADEIPAKRPYGTRIPEDLPEAGKPHRHLIAKVHAVADEGRILVVEYGDAVVPVFVKDPKLTEKLYRNDKVRIAFTLPDHPARPQHLWLDMADPTPLEILEGLVARHGQPYEAEGALVRYPLSPQLTSEVYALEVIDSDNVFRDFTLLNFDPAIFKTIREKLAAAWKSRPAQGVDGRNKLVNTQIRVRAKGTFNLVARNQANAQILLKSADDITITMLPATAASATVSRTSAASP